ncbi:DUF2141 domain-containing protein [Tenacibaculum retecalamus]|uniref:DUF2141 domain-containing protein n=1 Tax=Tenacibaculum retecalamus TaxID=3018315 RepID=UPI0023D91ABB|nr:DUF2141 domain-containing protein [Tenacibaculum retecalamus]WBX70412.1 DUF2141 domain-containing protein [Tenacibaculum retecalamus]
MKFLTAILILIQLFIVAELTAQNKEIQVTVVNATSDLGKISYALYTKDNFRKKPIKVASTIIKEGKSTVVFKDVPLGEYAVICFHDKNNNGKMDFKPNGMPLEDYGSSNNVINPYEPPQYEQSKFTVADKNVSLKIKF